MTPKWTDRTRQPSFQADRRLFLGLAAGLTTAGLAAAGCALPPIFRSQSPEETEDPIISGIRLVGDYAQAVGGFPLTVEAVGLVTGLPDTGSDPANSQERAYLLDEMEKRGVAYPNKLLASKETELVLIRAYLRPGIQKGDHFDVELRCATRSECTSLRGGWLMETRLKQFAAVKNQILEGKILALAEGAVLVDPSAEGERDRLKLTRGRVLGGGVATESRKLGLALRHDHDRLRENILTSAQIGNAINQRFHSFDAGIKRGVATPETDKYIEIIVHPRYKDNVERYMRVIRALPIRETDSQRIARLALLERQLLDPITAATAAIKLEALGKEGITALLKGASASDPEVRFYAAEALAYLDESAAVMPLAEASRHPAFRAYALTALSAMDDYTAYEALRDLLDLSSAETRYGAFRALWAMNGQDALVRGENMNGQFSYHLLETKGPPMVHVTRSFRAEVVVFGPDQRLLTPLMLEAGKDIQIISRGGDEITISRIEVGDEQKRVVSTKLDDVIRAVVALNGNYPDVVQMLQQAKSRKNLEARFEIDALPASGRSYDRKSEGDEEKDEKEFTIANPLPGLFARPGKDTDDRHKKSSSHRNDEDEDSDRGPSLLDKLTELFE
ncbi:MAG TPA: flagellar basal body P-ring protein FlgI [Pirellulales bacterium]|nr:flagellar basal body P-ring protein FlgI [Pirellulales bacterium]